MWFAIRYWLSSLHSKYPLVLYNNFNNLLCSLLKDCLILSSSTLILTIYYVQCLKIVLYTVAQTWTDIASSKAGARAAPCGGEVVVQIAAGVSVSNSALCTRAWPNFASFLHGPVMGVLALVYWTQSVQLTLWTLSCSGSLSSFLVAKSFLL